MNKQIDGGMLVRFVERIEKIRTGRKTSGRRYQGSIFAGQSTRI